MDKYGTKSDTIIRKALEELEGKLEELDDTLSNEDIAGLIREDSDNL